MRKQWRFAEALWAQGIAAYITSYTGALHALTWE
jgi:hypothetical protein